MMAFRARMQVAEALGADNRWFCSQSCGRGIDDPDALVQIILR